MLNLIDIFRKDTKNGININELLKDFVSYKITDTFSIPRSHEWICRLEYVIFLPLYNNLGQKIRAIHLCKLRIQIKKHLSLIMVI